MSNESECESCKRLSAALEQALNEVDMAHAFIEEKLDMAEKILNHIKYIGFTAGDLIDMAKKLNEGRKEKAKDVVDE